MTSEQQGPTDEVLGHGLRLPPEDEPAGDDRGKRNPDDTEGTPTAGGRTPRRPTRTRATTPRGTVGIGGSEAHLTCLQATAALAPSAGPHSLDDPHMFCKQQVGDSSPCQLPTPQRS